MNSITLVLFDLALGNQRKLLMTALYLLTVALTLMTLVPLRAVAIFAMLGNSLSASLGPLGVLSALVRHHRKRSGGALPANKPVLHSAVAKSLIWLSYGTLKQALPIVVSHVCGLFVLTNIFFFIRYANTNHFTLAVPVFMGSLYESIANFMCRCSVKPKVA